MHPLPGTASAPKAHRARPSPLTTGQPAARALPAPCARERTHARRSLWHRESTSQRQHAPGVQTMPPASPPAHRPRSRGAPPHPKGPDVPAAWRPHGGRAACLGRDRDHIKNPPPSAPSAAAPHAAGAAATSSSRAVRSPAFLSPHRAPTRRAHDPVSGHAPTRPSRPDLPFSGLAHHARCPVLLPSGLVSCPWSWHPLASFMRRSASRRVPRAASCPHLTRDRRRLPPSRPRSVRWPSLGAVRFPSLAQCHPRRLVPSGLPRPVRCSYDPRLSRTIAMPQDPLQVVPAFCRTPPWPLDAQGRRSPVPVARPSTYQTRNHPGFRLRPTRFLCTTGRRASNPRAV